MSTSDCTAAVTDRQGLSHSVCSDSRIEIGPSNYFWPCSIPLPDSSCSIKSEYILETCSYHRAIGLVLDSIHRLVCGRQNKPNSSVQHTPSSESFQVYMFIPVESIISSIFNDISDVKLSFKFFI
jgi:hypothetical protein